MRLCEAPVGLFLFEDTLCMMTEYSSDGCGRHAYIVSSGEMFWGGAKSKEERANLEVTPVEVRLDELSPRWISVEEGLPDLIGCNAGTAYSETVLVWTSGRKVMAAVFDGDDFLCAADYWEAEDELVTHWRSIGALPGEED